MLYITLRYPQVSGQARLLPERLLLRARQGPGRPRGARRHHGLHGHHLRQRGAGGRLRVPRDAGRARAEVADGGGDAEHVHREHRPDHGAMVGGPLQGHDAPRDLAEEHAGRGHAAVAGLLLRHQPRRGAGAPVRLRGPGEV